ncbi:FAD-binding oxidoreductase [Paenibacillaceae bacterium]|nr:FAD-binding oxidoreductase [Paenibacillaceae bacterium]
MKKGLALLLLAALCVFTYVRTDRPDQDPYLITDYSRLHPVKVERVATGREQSQLVKLVQEAREKGLALSIAGQRHSQGGHTYYKDGIVVDMTSYNKILKLDTAGKTIRVQAGATWEAIQHVINPHGLAVKTMQSQNIFTVGGSISVNAHGRDIRSGSMIASVESFRLLTAEGKIIHVSRSENSELFPLVLGGFGLFGIILDVTLYLTDDEVYTIVTEAMSVQDYTDYFVRQVLPDPAIRMHMARVSTAPGSFLEEMYTMNYVAADNIPLNKHHQLQTRELGITVGKALFQLNRSSKRFKGLFWQLQTAHYSNLQGNVISRNNAMRANSQFMEYSNIGKADLLQEYFIPVEQYADFIAAFKAILLEEKLNLLNITVRFVKEDHEAVLSYANADSFALVCLFHTPLSAQAREDFQQGIETIIDEVLKHGGTYYLPYAPFPTTAQFAQAYPSQQYFFARKDLYDPEGIFMNYFYERYSGREEIDAN